MYRQAGPQGRRLLNQLFFDKLMIDGDQVVEERLTELFHDLQALRRFEPYYRRTLRSGITMDAASVRFGPTDPVFAGHGHPGALVSTSWWT
jgi:hypothetical protein